MEKNAQLSPKQIWISELKRTHQTAAYVRAPKTPLPELNELESGEYDDLTYEEFEQKFPEKFRERELNKLCFRYPGGESYVDLCRYMQANIWKKVTWIHSTSFA